MNIFTKIVSLAAIMLIITISGCTATDTGPEPIPDIVENEDEGSFMISTSSFENNGKIPSKYTCEGDNINPELVTDNLPEDTVSLVLIVEDPDAPMGTFTHWIVWNIEPGSIIVEDTVPGIQGLNDFKKTNYSGPCPPSGTHRYFFRIYALDTMLELESGSTRTTIEKAMMQHVIAEGELMGTYSRD
ncbi:YbhB/YbcL family Raf kinase inhibitor-like protein [Methanococcoides sp. FTZ1]|uniref:YbhB/YbcL family Raf kinase inhibitor-like protein n=1 Tax=Methanococcoides sp. FTZ1 TaxID=3439061 RepID=UPI003F858588